MSSQHDSVQDQIARLSADIFDAPIPNYPQNYQQPPQNYPVSSSQMAPPNYPHNYPQNYPPNYQRRDQMLDLNYQQPPQMSAPPPYYTSNDPNVLIPQETLQPTPPYTYGGIGSSSVASSQFTDTAPIGEPEIQEELAPPSTSDPPQEPEGKKTKRPPPEYNQPWARYYKITRDNKNIMKFLQCKVKGCQNFFEYKQTSGMTSFKRHAGMHEKNGEVPSENPKPRQIQTL